MWLRVLANSAAARGFVVKIDNWHSVFSHRGINVCSMKIWICRTHQLKQHPLRQTEVLFNTLPEMNWISVGATALRQIALCLSLPERMHNWEQRMQIGTREWQIGTRECSLEERTGKIEWNKSPRKALFKALVTIGKGTETTFTQRYSGNCTKCGRPLWNLSYLCLCKYHVQRCICCQEIWYFKNCKKNWGERIPQRGKRQDARVGGKLVDLARKRWRPQQGCLSPN